VIVKLQRALFSTERGDPPALVYDRNREHQCMIHLSSVQLEALLGSDDKGYFEASIEDGNVVLGKRVAAQPW